MKIVRFLLRPRVRWLLCWLLLFGWAGATGVGAWFAFNGGEQAKTAGEADEPGEGNRGHSTIDFGGQWLMGRMIVERQGRHLYLRNYLWPVAQRNYVTRKEAESLMAWLTGTDDPRAPEVVASLLIPLAAGNPLDETVAQAATEPTWSPEELEHITAPRIGGALYPPIHASYYAALALLRPPTAYRVMQLLLLGLVFFAGWAAQCMTEGRVWWPVASLFVLMFPGYAGCITLGQNGMLLLTVVLVGWWQLMRGREVLAGLCWGLLAFKPVWAAAFFLVPLLTARWRMAAAMAGAGIVQVVMTLPVVGWESWQNWLHIGREASFEYKRQENWIVLSRDLLGIPRRWLLIFEDGLAKDLVWTAGEVSGTATEAAENRWDSLSLDMLGWGLWAAVLAGTLFVVWRRRQLRSELTGQFPAFVMSAAVLICYHFMYYDFLVAALPMLVLFTEPRRYLRWRVRALVPPVLLFLMLAIPGLNCLCDPSYHFPPWETFVLLLLWAWCGYCLLRSSSPESEPRSQRSGVSGPPIAAACSAALRSPLG